MIPIGAWFMAHKQHHGSQWSLTISLNITVYYHFTWCPHLLGNYKKNIFIPSIKTTYLSNQPNLLIKLHLMTLFVWLVSIGCEQWSASDSTYDGIQLFLNTHLAIEHFMANVEFAVAKLDQKNPASLPFVSSPLNPVITISKHILNICRFDLFFPKMFRENLSFPGKDDEGDQIFQNPDRDSSSVSE